MLKLRGHHLFCLVGFRGMGYSEEFAENMKNIHKGLKENPKTLIQLIDGVDHICEKYPEYKEYHCLDQNIFDKDKQILEKLNLQVGQTLTWEEVESRIRKYVTPEDIDVLCYRCSWRSHGLCKGGIQRILNGAGLWEIK